MDPNRISKEGQTTGKVFERLETWLRVDPERRTKDEAIPRIGPDAGDPRTAWSDLRFDVPDRVSVADLGSVRRPFVRSRESHPGEKESGANGKRARSQDQGAS